MSLHQSQATAAHETGLLLPGHYLGLNGAATLRTTSLALTERAVRDLAARHAMGVLHGPAGCGKTFAWQIAARLLEIAVCAVTFPSGTTRLNVARTVMRALTGKLRRGSRFDLSDELIDVLSEHNRLLVVDEAQWLNGHCIEYLRHVHDDPRTRFGLLLVGGNGCWEVLSREPMLRSRLHRRVVFGPLDRSAILNAIPAYHGLYRDCDPKVIGYVDDVFAHGFFRNWAKFTLTAIEIAAPDAPLTKEAAKATLVLLNGSDSFAL